MSIGDTIKTSLYVSRAMLKRLKDRAFEDHSSVNDVVHAAIENYLKTAPNSEQNKVAQSTSENPDVVLTSGIRKRHSSLILQEFEPWVSYLLHILRGANPYAVPSIQKNLEAFSRLTDVDGGRHEPPPEITDNEIDDLRERARRQGAEIEEPARDRGPKPGRRRKAS